MPPMGAGPSQYVPRPTHSGTMRPVPTDSPPGTRRTGVFCLLALLVATGCSVHGTYRAPKPSMPTTWTASGTLREAGLSTSTTGDLSRWWLKLGDPVLTRLIQRALRSSPDLDLARAKLQQARAKAQAAGAARYPELSASGSAGVTQSAMTSGRTTTASLGVGLDASWEIDLFGGVRKSIEAATADAQAQHEALRGVRVSLAAEVAIDYIQIRTAQKQLAVLKRNLMSQRSTLELTRLREKAGLAHEQEVEQAAASCTQTEARIPALKATLATAEHSLELLLGARPGALHATLGAGEVNLPVVPSTLAVGIPADILRRRPDIRSAERTLAAENAREGVAVAALYPSLKLSGSIGLEALMGSPGGGVGVTTSLLGGITAPLFQAGRLRAQVRMQAAVVRQALLTYRKTVLTALSEVENALTGIARSRQQHRLLHKALTSAKHAATLARQRFESGLIDFQPVLETERTVLTLEDSLITAQAEEMLQVIRLYKALGGGWSPPKNEQAETQEKAR